LRLFDGLSFATYTGRSVAYGPATGRDRRRRPRRHVDAVAVAAPGTMVRMDLRADAGLAINELLAQHGHLVDEGALDRRGELFTDPFADGLQVGRHPRKRRGEAP